MKAQWCLPAARAFPHCLSLHLSAAVIAEVLDKSLVTIDDVAKDAPGITAALVKEFLTQTVCTY